MKVRRRYTQHTLGLATQRSALGHCVQNELHKETIKKINEITSVFWLLMLCLFARGFVIFLILACISFPFLMLFNAFLWVAAHFHTFSVSSWPVCEFFLLSLRRSFHCFFMKTRVRTFEARLLSSQRACFLLRCPACSVSALSSRLCFSFLAL